MRVYLKSVFLNRWAAEIFLVGRQTCLILFKTVIAYKFYIKSQTFQIQKHQEKTK